MDKGQRRPSKAFRCSAPGKRRKRLLPPWNRSGGPALAVGSLAAAGKYSRDHLFYLYALLPLAVGFVAEQLRVTSAQTILDQRSLRDAEAVGALPERQQRRIVDEIMRREVGVMALSALVVVFLALRASATAHGF